MSLELKCTKLWVKLVQQQIIGVQFREGNRDKVQIGVGF